MWRTTATLAVLAAVVVVASAASGTGARTASVVGSSGPDAGDSSGPVAGLETDVTPLPAGSSAAPLAGTVSVPLTISLEGPRAAEWSAFLSAVEDPASPDYRDFLTYSEYLSEFAPTSAEAASVVDVLDAHGATGVTVTPDRAGILANLPASQVETLFGVTLEQYASAGPGHVPVYSAEGTPTLPASLRGEVLGVDGLSDAGALELDRSLHAGALRVDSGPGVPSFVFDNQSDSEWFVGSDFTTAYDATALFPGSGLANATYPTHVAIATLLASGYNESMGQNLPPWDPSVVETYFNQTFPAAWPKPTVTGVPVAIGADVPPGPGSFGAVNDSTLDEFENSLDLEMAGSLAPGASLYNFYFAGNLLANSTSIPNIAGDFAASLSEALSYNYSPEHLAVVSGSFGLPDLTNTLWAIELGVAAATGVTVTVASGDQGDAPDSLTDRGTGPWPSWPATDADNTSGAVSVGGVSMTLGGTPTSYANATAVNLSYDKDVRGITQVATWYSAVPGQYLAGSEGGVSTVYPEPEWQFDSAAQYPIVNATELEGASALGRAGPDVALIANTTLATVWANATGTVYLTELAGTSIAAPVLAGLLADIVGVESLRSSTGWAPLGFVTPELYRIASYYAGDPTAPGDPFAPVVEGHNYLFSAAPGWNPTTGWGQVNATLLLSADENATVRDYQYTGPTPVLPPTKSTPAGFPWPTVVVILAVGAVAAVVLVLLAVVRPSRGGPATVPPGASGAPAVPFGPGVQGGIYPGATFLCPYCGAVRPAEPVRCAQCGAY